MSGCAPRPKRHLGGKWDRKKRDGWEGRGGARPARFLPTFAGGFVTWPRARSRRAAVEATQAPKNRADEAPRIQWILEPPEGWERSGLPVGASLSGLAVGGYHMLLGSRWGGKLGRIHRTFLTYRLLRR